MTITTLTELLQFHTRHHPDKVAYTFLADGETATDFLTYADLDQRAKTLAATLVTISEVGDRILLVYPAGLEFIIAFFGCLYGGRIPVPAYPPKLNQSLDRLTRILTDAEPTVILTTQILKTNLKSRCHQLPTLTAFTSLTWLATDSLEIAQDFHPYPGTPGTLALLQYTSGSTGTPKGVMITHENILYNQQMIRQAFRHSETTIFVGWLPLFHDMGLIGNVLQPLYLGVPSILMPPMAFLTKPIRWLRAISEYRGTTSGAPNFAYQLCVRNIKPHQQQTLDLSCWQVAFNGSEPIRSQTLEQFAETFAPSGFRSQAFYPCYGLAEATLFVAGEDSQQHYLNSKDQDNVTVGHSWLDEKIIIVDPETNTLCPPGTPGEIWLSGAHVAQGYWCRESEETFAAKVENFPGEKFLRTGDLGYFKNNHLFLTGRLKDVIIIRGQNYYPQDIELTVEQTDLALRPSSGAAFSVYLKGEDRLIVVQEIERTYLNSFDPQNTLGKIRQAVLQEHNLQVYAAVFLKPGHIPKTSSGKIKRYRCREQFLAQTLPGVIPMN